MVDSIKKGIQLIELSEKLGLLVEHPKRIEALMIEITFLL